MDTHSMKRKLSAAYRYSYARMALNYYSFNEMMCGDRGIPADVKAYAKELHQLIQEFLTGNQRTDSLDSLNHLRNRVIVSMEVITSYTDCFQIYEYVLNRMERRFSDCVKAEIPPQLRSGVRASSVEEFTDRIMEYLMRAEDGVIMNDRIQQVIGQLPVRYTKQKFHQLLMDGMSVYIGSEKKSLNDMMYILRTESMAQLPEDMARGHEDLYEILNQLKTADFLHMDKNTYLSCMDRIVYVSERLYEDAGIYMMLQDVINDFYVLLLTSGEAMIDLEEKQILEKIVHGVLDHFLEGNTSLIEDQITELLCDLEGIQESAMERYLSCLSADTSDGHMAGAADKVDKLLSGSPFVSLAEHDAPTEGESVDRPFFVQTMEAFFEKLDAVFAVSPKPVVRAIMAKLLSSLPVVFGSSEELRDYIVRSLESCTDVAERETSMELIEQDMVEEDALV